MSSTHKIRSNLVFATLKACEGKNHSEVGRRAGLSPTTVSNWRKGITEWPNSRSIYKVLTAYGKEIQVRDSKTGEVTETPRKRTANKSKRTSDSARLMIN